MWVLIPRSYQYVRLHYVPRVWKLEQASLFVNLPLCRLLGMNIAAWSMIGAVYAWLIDNHNQSEFGSGQWYYDVGEMSPP